MKLLLCANCRDIVRVFADERSCRCGRSRGRYLKRGHAVVVEGPCDVLTAATSIVYGHRKGAHLRRMPEPHGLVHRRDNGWHSMLGVLREHGGGAT